MKTSIFILIGILFGCDKLVAQNYDKIYFDSLDSTNYYYQVEPDSEAKGLLILLPGARGNSEWPLKTTEIPYIAADSGLITIMIDYEKWFVWLREDILSRLNKSIEDVILKNRIPKNKCVIGGFSAGGAMALSYTQLAYNDSSNTTIIPCGVFGLDPPLDLVELYNAYNRDVRGYSCLEVRDENEVAGEESISMEKNMRQFLGTPKENFENYRYHSSFLWSERYGKGGQAIHLTDVPVRVYVSYSADYFDRKAEGCSFYPPTAPFFISFLKSIGNDNATFKNQFDLDYTPDGGEEFRGRHAWKGFDSQECVEWIMKTIKSQ